MSKQLIEKLSRIQSILKAPKNQRNNFGNYNYRNQEDILEAAKPLLAQEGLVLTLEDEIIAVGNRIYVKAIAELTDGEFSIKKTAFARESETKKGMDDSQITGSTSSYARKYALNGMFLIDDTKDADATNTHDKEPVKQAPVQKTAPSIIGPASPATASGATVSPIKAESAQAPTAARRSFRKSTTSSEEL